MAEAEVALGKHLRNAIYSFDVLAIISFVLSVNEETSKSILHLAVAFLAIDGIVILLLLFSIWLRHRPYI